jgi:hypothetical protein
VANTVSLFAFLVLNTATVLVVGVADMEVEAVAGTSRSYRITPKLVLLSFSPGFFRKRLANIKSSYGGGDSFGGGGGGGFGGAGGGGFGGGSNLGATLGNIDFAKQELVPFEKNFYLEHPDVSARSDQEAEAWRASKQIVIRGSDIPKPVLTFEEASMPEYVLSEVIKCGFDKPTAIQSQGWPMALKGRNMVGISATGSGKVRKMGLLGMWCRSCCDSSSFGPHCVGFLSGSRSDLFT